MAASDRGVIQSDSSLNPVHDFSDSDSEDDRIRLGANDSMELAEHDRQLLREEEERESFLTEGSSKGRRELSGYKASKETEASRDRRRSGRQSRKSRRRKHDGTSDEQGHLMYEMEEGGPKEDISSSASSSSVELNKIQAGKARTIKVCSLV